MSHQPPPRPTVVVDQKLGERSRQGSPSRCWSSPHTAIRCTKSGSAASAAPSQWHSHQRCQCPAQPDAPSAQGPGVVQGQTHSHQHRQAHLPGGVDQAAGQRAARPRRGGLITTASQSTSSRNRATTARSTRRKVVRQQPGSYPTRQAGHCHSAAPRRPGYGRRGRESGHRRLSATSLVSRRARWATVHRPSAQSDLPLGRRDNMQQEHEQGCARPSMPARAPVGRGAQGSRSST